MVRAGAVAAVMVALAVAAPGCGAPGVASTGGARAEGATVWIYADGALVRERRWVELPAGISRLRLDDATLEPGSVWLRALGDDPDAVTGGALEALAMPAGQGGEAGKSAEENGPIAAMIEATPGRYVGERVEVVAGGATLRGELVAVDDQSLQLRRDDEVITVARAAIEAVRLPDERAVAPEVVVRAPRAGRYLLEIGYLDRQLSWRPEYQATTDEAGAVALGLRALVTNRSALRLVEPEVVLYDGPLDGAGIAVWRGAAELDPGEARLILLERAPVEGRFGAVYRLPATGRALDPHADPTQVRWQMRLRAAADARALPAGPIALDVASAEPRLGQLARRLEPGDAARLDFGAVPGLSVTYAQLGFVPSGEEVTETWQISIASQREDAVPVRIEDPRPPRAVRLVRARPEARVRAGTLEADLMVEPGGVTTLVYRIAYPRRHPSGPD